MLHRIRRILLKARWARMVARELTASPGHARAVYVAFVRMLFGGHDQARLTLTWNGCTFSFSIRGHHDLGTLVEVFVHEEYAAATVSGSAVILDLGANTGASSVYFALRFPDAIIHAYEPDASNRATLVGNAAAFPRISIWQEAVSGADGTVVFHEDPETGNSSSIARRKDRQRAVEVPAVSLDTVLSRLPGGRADLVKYDIEGAEYALFDDHPVSAMIDALIGEHHQDLGPDDALMDHLRASYMCVVRQLGPSRTLVYSVRKTRSDSP